MRKYIQLNTKHHWLIFALDLHFVKVSALSKQQKPSRIQYYVGKKVPMSPMHWQVRAGWFYFPCISLRIKFRAIWMLNVVRVRTRDSGFHCMAWPKSSYSPSDTTFSKHKNWSTPSMLCSLIQIVRVQWLIRLKSLV